MTIPTEYGWFVAVVWPDERGVATARIYEWDRSAGTMGALVESFAFAENPDFYACVGARYYEAVEGQLAASVHHQGFRIALRRELVPVLIPA